MFGEKLGVPTNELSAIQSSSSAEGVGWWKTSMFEYYVNKCNPSWIHVCDVLEEIGYTRQADKLKEIYICKMASDGKNIEI